MAMYSNNHQIVAVTRTANMAAGAAKTVAASNNNHRSPPIMEAVANMAAETEGTMVAGRLLKTTVRTWQGKAALCARPGFNQLLP
jgi:hypothetical protein